MSSQQLVRLAIDADVARLTFSRPEKRNALSRAFMSELRAALDSLTPRHDLRLLIVEANGPVFCAGMDLAEMQQHAAADDPPAEWHADTEAYRDLIVHLFTLEMPTLAVLQGPAVAGGVGLALACDLVLAAESAYLALPEPRRGIVAALVTPLLLYRAGASAASRLLLSGQNLPAHEARQCGLFHEVVADSELAGLRDEWVGGILTGSRESLAVTKRQIQSCNAAELLAQLDAAVILSAEARATPDAREGLTAFLEGRTPGWAK